MTIEYTQAQPLDLVGAHYSLRIFIGASNSTRVYFADSAGTTLAPVTALFFGVDDMILDFCSQLVGGTTPTDSGNFDIKSFMWFSGPAIVYTKTASNYMTSYFCCSILTSPSEPKLPPNRFSSPRPE